MGAQKGTCFGNRQVVWCNGKDNIDTMERQYYENPVPRDPIVIQRARELASQYPECQGKEEILQILFSASSSFLLEQNSTQACQRLPTWESIRNRYGTGPIIVGLETCATYRSLLEEHNTMVSNQSSHTKEAAAVATAKLAKSKDISIILPNEQLQREEEEAYYYAYRPVVRVAGLYNTGTNTLSYAIHNNLKQSAMMGGMGPSFTGELLSKQYRVMWGKHNPVHQKYRNTMEGRQNDPRNLTLPIVIVRDPYWWIKSMCKANYDMWWNKTVGGTSCPEILNAQTLEPNEARVYYEVWSAKNKDKLLVRYPSVPDVWTSWIREYVNADFPRLFVRYEDLLFHGETVMQAISECSGVPRNGNTNGDSSNNLPYKYQMGRSKNHGKAMGLVESIERYIDEDVRRIMRWTPAEQNYTQQQALAPDLMKLFHYEY